MAIVEYTMMAVWCLLLLIPYLDMAPAMVCDCTLFRSHAPHLTTPWLLVAGTNGLLMTIVLVVDLGPVGALPWPLFLFYALLILWYWWRHSKGDRKKLRDRVLARVRKLAGRLVVQPVPA